MVCGIPQSSTVEQLLFLKYINDMLLVVNLQVKSFADDANLTLSDRDVHFLNDVENELKKMEISCRLLMSFRLITKNY